MTCLDFTYRCGVFLRNNYIGYGAVIGAVLTGTACDGPTADGGIFKRLREVAAGVRTLCAEKALSVLKRFLELWSGHTCLNGNGLVGLIEFNDLVEVAAHIKRNTAVNGLNASCNRRAAAVNIERYFILCDVGYDFLNLLACLRENNEVGKRVKTTVTHSEKIVHCLSVGNGETVVVAL